MTAKFIIEKKRDGRGLSAEEISWFIDCFTRGEIPDCQMSSLAMAVCCRGMDDGETAALTDAMTRSGASFEWDAPSADKHSTGGVGDKLSFVVQPLAASCGVLVPSLVGRGLGITGGTADKLDSIPGFKTSLSVKDFRKAVETAGLAMAVQTAEIAPADRKLYALRDVTGTVASTPLIVASILSKKLAEGARSLVFDVKHGSGAFMATEEDARVLAAALVKGAEASGRKAFSFVSDMSSPTGFAVGNANEVAEALSLLSGSFDRRLEPVLARCVDMAARMVSLSLGMDPAAAAALCREKLADGSAMAKFEKMVETQGGDLDAFSKSGRGRIFKFCVQAWRSGVLEAVDARTAGECAVLLGAGRAEQGDALDYRAGIDFHVVAGEKIRAGDPLATISTSRDPDVLDGAASALVKAFRFAPS